MPSPRKRRVVDDSSSSDTDAEPTVSQRRIVSPRKRQRIALDEDDEVDTAPPKKPLTFLPDEILFTVLENVAIPDLLDLRRLNKAFREEIDTRILYHHIQRTEFIGYLGCSDYPLFENLSPKEHQDFAFVRARFDRLEEVESGQAKWDAESALFRIEPQWFTALEAIGGRAEPDDPYWEHAVECLWNFFKEETALQERIKHYEGWKFTFGHVEDCMIDLRRQRYRAALDPNDKRDLGLRWRMDNLPQLYGKETWSRVACAFSDIEEEEQRAGQVIMLLRKEAAMSRRQHNQLRSIAEARKHMHKETEHLDTLFKKWQENLLGLPSLSLERLKDTAVESLDSVDPNPVTWSAQTLAKVQDSLKRWDGQRNVIKQMTSFLDATNAVAELPEDAFNGDGLSDDD
ncbi:hypothetical protein BDV96DRAFT_607010 [Lophiotrema nucula]|uniref:F-box domain-containing protein n=1 Tax=Lophiotrema nucula TaxID=690887 RepID=A0A6A5YIV2_9PLEO|nr:hypothetical protein BDV96DRAFT_607010 [Lophiotrema nucula]